MHGQSIMHDNHDPWWVIGSAAMLMFGHAEGTINDVDFLVSARDAKAISDRLNLPNLADSSSELSRSPFLLHPKSDETAIEIIADLKIKQGDIWMPVALTSRETHNLNGSTLYTPDRTELAALYRRIGRDKDQRRAAQLDCVIPSSQP